MSEPLTPAERATVRSRFAVALANLGVFDAYWLPSRRCLTVRSVSCQRHFALAREAQHVGRYVSPFPASTFLEDLDELLAQSIDG